MQANLLKQSTNDHDLRLHRLFKLPVWPSACDGQCKIHRAANLLIRLIPSPGATLHVLPLPRCRAGYLKSRTLFRLFFFFEQSAQKRTLAREGEGQELRFREETLREAPKLFDKAVDAFA